MRSRWTLVAFGAALAVLVILAACQSQYLSGGKLHFDQKRYDRALENFELAIAEQPANGEAHLWRARALAELERDEEAVTELKKAVELDPLQKEMVDNTFISYWSRRYNSALAFAKEADAARGEGKPEASTAQLQQAEERFRRAIVYAPDSVQNYSNLGRVLFQLGQRDEAMTFFQKAKEMSAGKPHLQAFLFSLFKALGEQALQTNDRDSLERALPLLHDAENLPATPERMLEVHFNLGSVYYALAEADSARAAEYLAQAEVYYGKVLAVDPADAMALESLAGVYSDQGKHEQALATAQKRLDIDPWEDAPHLLMQRVHKAAKNDRMANGHLLLIKIRQEGSRLPIEAIRTDAAKWGPSSDMLKLLRERGIPDERRDYTIGAATYEAWFYWLDGRIAIFQDGAERFRTNFKGVTRDKLAELLAG
jgi:tetratricopeptide (TPR) repeat protein